jgi:pimeloyl-ACP methyl ester carboxylesterase
VLKDPFGSGAFFLLGDVLDNGWALVATDYVGLGTEGGHPYLVGPPAGRSVLDAVRAARQLAEANLADETVVWGHSQGGGAALWTGVIASTYAPDVDVLGVAALAPASDLAGLVTNFGNVPGGSIFASYVLDGYSDTYSDVRVDDYVRPAARSIFEETADRCLAEPSALISVLESLTTGSEMFSTDLDSGALLRRLQENVPTGPIERPLLLAQGAADGLVLPQVQTAYVEARCDDGQAIDYRTYDGLGHVPLVEADSPLAPELLAWTQDRLDGTAPTPTCN